MSFDEPCGFLDSSLRASAARQEPARIRDVRGACIPKRPDQGLFRCIELLQAMIQLGCSRLHVHLAEAFKGEPGCPRDLDGFIGWHRFIIAADRPGAVRQKSHSCCHGMQGGARFAHFGVQCLEPVE